MNKKGYRQFNKRYDKFKKNNLPTPFWDEERQTLEYVYYDSSLDPIYKELKTNTKDYDYRLHVEKNLTEALSNVAYTGFYYPFTSKYFRLSRVDEDTTEQKIEVGHTHVHSFEEVVRYLCDFPESFNISKEEEKFYSKQELEYLKRIQKYLLFIGVKDLETNKPKIERYRNKLHKKYENALIYKFNAKTIEDFVSKKRDFTVQEYYNSFKPRKFEKGNFRALIVNEEGDFKLFVEFTFEELIKYQNIKDILKNDKYKDDDLLILKHFKILERYEK